MTGVLLELDEEDANSTLSTAPSRRQRTRRIAVAGTSLGGLWVKIARTAGVVKKERAAGGSDGRCSNSTTIMDGSDAEDGGETQSRGSFGSDRGHLVTRAWLRGRGSVGSGSTSESLRREEWVVDDADGEGKEEQEVVWPDFDELGKNKVVIVEIITKIEVTVAGSETLGNSVIIEATKVHARPRQHLVRRRPSPSLDASKTPPSFAPNFIDSFPPGPVVLLSNLPYDEETFDTLYKLELQ